LQIHTPRRHLMRTTLGERTLVTLLVVPTAVAVVKLAVVQYRWSEEVRNATSVRLADSLQMSMMSWHLNLFRDLSDVCLRLRIDSDRLDGHELTQTVRRFYEQQGLAEYPDVVAELDVLSLDSNLPALRWNTSSRAFDRVEDGARIRTWQDTL